MGYWKQFGVYGAQCTKCKAEQDEKSEELGICWNCDTPFEACEPDDEDEP